MSALPIASASPIGMALPICLYFAANGPQTCIVTDEKLGEMGDAYVFVYEGREIKLCCKGCLKDFNKSSAKYVKKIQEAEAKAKKRIGGSSSENDENQGTPE